MTVKTYERNLTDRLFSAIRNNEDVEETYMEYESHIHALEGVGLFPNSFYRFKVEDAYRKFMHNKKGWENYE